MYTPVEEKKRDEYLFAKQKKREREITFSVTRAFLSVIYDKS